MWKEMNGAKLAMMHITGVCRKFSVDLPEGCSFLQAAPNPSYRRKLFQRLGLRVYEGVLGAISRLAGGQPTLLSESHWDYCIILDACRWDTFCGVYGRTVSKVISPGSSTFEWAKANFVDVDSRKVDNILLVTANPIFSKEHFSLKGWRFSLKECISVWKDGWDEEVGTVRPHKMVKACCEALLRSDSRAIFHFLQPHSPFIGDPSITRSVRRDDQPTVMPNRTVWDMLESGAIGMKEVQDAYEGNLRLVLEWVKKLVGVLNGRVVITSDHGNLFGEYGLFGHPIGIHVPELVTVPWLEM
jgi:hypothetical protein